MHNIHNKSTTRLMEWKAFYTCWYGSGLRYSLRSEAGLVSDRYLMAMMGTLHYLLKLKKAIMASPTPNVIWSFEIIYMDKGPPSNEWRFSAVQYTQDVWFLALHFFQTCPPFISFHVWYIAQF